MSAPGDEYAAAMRRCARWAGRKAGDEYPCKSKLVGRPVKLGQGMKAREVTVQACAVPRSSKPSKACAPDYIVATAGGRRERIDGGRIRNATRTPRPTHDPAMAPDHDDPRRYQFHAGVAADNRRDGLPGWTGLDYPFRHRIASGICCPEHPLSGAILGDALRWAEEGEGIAPELGSALVRLARHLRDKHRVRLDVPDRLGPEDFEAARSILAAEDDYCVAYGIEWDASQEQRAEERKKARKRRKATEGQKAKAKRSRAMKNAHSETKAAVRRAIAKSAKPSKPSKPSKK